MIPINNLVLDLSKMLFDQRNAIGEDDALHDYPQALLVLAINRGVRDLLNGLFEKETTEGIVSAMPEYVVEGGINMVGGEGDMPDNAYKGLAVKASVAGGEVLAIYVAPSKWYAIQESYNVEESATAEYPRWTEFDNKVKITGLSPASITYQYLKNYEDIAISGNIDLNAKYYNQILDLAYAFIMKLSPIQ